MKKTAFNKKNILFLILLSIFLQSCEKEVSVTPPSEPVPIASIFIDSEPKGAKIYENGRNSSRVTPDSLNWLEEKTYNFTLRKELFRDTSFAVTIKKDEKKEIFIDYYSNPKMLSKIKFATVPEGASVFLNGDSLNITTPATIGGIKPGVYKAVFKKQHCYPDSMEITVRSNVTTDAVMTLKDTTYWVDYRIANSQIPSNYLRAVAVDKFNIVWIGTLDGIASFNGAEWTHYNTTNSPLMSNYINCLSIDEQNKLWIGTDLGLYIKDGPSWRIYRRHPKQMPTDTVTAIYLLGQNNALIGTNIGLLKMTAFNFEKLSNHSMITDVGVDKFHNIWVTLYLNGARLLPLGANAQWQEYYTEDNGRLYCIAFGDDYIWFGHRQEVNSLDATYGLTSVRYGDHRRRIVYDEFTNADVFDITIKQNEKWICSSKGLYIFEEYPNFERYNQFNTVMERNIIRGVAFDSNGNAWVATSDDGLFKFKYSLIK